MSTHRIRIRTALVGVLGGALALGGLAGIARAQGSSATTPVLAVAMAPARGGAPLRVASSAFRGGHTIPRRFTQFGASESPPLHWTRGPSGTQSYVLLVEDSGVNRPEPFIHWVLYNVPAAVTHLAANLSRDPQLKQPAGAMNGLNGRDQPGYIGPRPPRGQTHPYHFEVFALDRTLSLAPDGATRHAVVNAMKGHVLAEGQLVGNVTGR